MIKFLVLVNKQGQTRLARYYEDLVDVNGEDRAVQVREGEAQACFGACLSTSAHKRPEARPHHPSRTNPVPSADCRQCCLVADCRVL
jgi:hypothetical protein